MIRLVGSTGNQEQIADRGQVVFLLIPVASSMNIENGMHSLAILDALAAGVGARRRNRPVSIGKFNSPFVSGIA